MWWHSKNKSHIKSRDWGCVWVVFFLPLLNVYPAGDGHTEVLLFGLRFTSLNKWTCFSVCQDRKLLFRFLKYLWRIICISFFLCHFLCSPWARVYLKCIYYIFAVLVIKCLWVFCASLVLNWRVGLRFICASNFQPIFCCHYLQTQ